jgi:superfamily II DNA helicase RecQ
MKVFALPFNEQQENFDDRILREFLQDKQVTSKSDYLFEKNGKVYLAVVVRYTDGIMGTQGIKPTFNQITPERLEPKQNKQEGSSNFNGFHSKAEKKNNTPGGKEKKQPYQPLGLNQEQMNLFERMRKWRYERARKQFIPAYMICSNKELERIIEVMPKTVEQLASVEGMSGTKVKNHGEPMIEALGKMLSN